MVIQKKNIDRKMRLLAFLLNWNVITGIIESLARVQSLSFLAGFSSVTVVFSVIFVLVTVLFTIKDSLSWRTYLIVPAWVMLFALSCLICPGILPLSSRAFIYFMNNIFCIAVLLQSVTDFEDLLLELKRYIPLTVFYAALQWIVKQPGEEYSMSFSYATVISLLLCLLVCLNEKKHRVFYVICTVIIVVTNFVYGSRGSFLCCALALPFYFLFTDPKKKFKSILAFSVIALGAILFWDNILLIIQNNFPDSRNAVLLIQNKVFYGSGRKVIYSKLIEQIGNNPFSINGLYSDRVLISAGADSKDVLWGNYAHNFFLEALYQWGVLCIPLVILLIIRMVELFSNARKKSKEYQIMLILVYAFSIVQLMLSSSYLISPSFGLLLGMLFQVRRSNSKIKSFNSCLDL